MLINWFEVDDVFQRICVLFYVVCLLGFTTNLEYAFKSTYTSMIAFYLTQRLFSAGYYLWVAYLVPTVAGTMICNALVVALSAAQRGHGQVRQQLRVARRSTALTVTPC